MIFVWMCYSIMWSSSNIWEHWKTCYSRPSWIPTSWQYTSSSVHCSFDHATELTVRNAKPKPTTTQFKPLNLGLYVVWLISYILQVSWAFKLRIILLFSSSETICVAQLFLVFFGFVFSLFFFFYPNMSVFYTPIIALYYLGARHLPELKWDEILFYSGQTEGGGKLSAVLYI